MPNFISTGTSETVGNPKRAVAKIETVLDTIDDIKTERAMKILGDRGGDFEKYSILKATGLVDRGGDKGPLDRQPKFFSKRKCPGKLKKNMAGKDLSRISEKIRYLKGLTDSCECFQSDDDDGQEDLLADSTASQLVIVT